MICTKNSLSRSYTLYFIILVATSHEVKLLVICNLLLSFYSISNEYLINYSDEFCGKSAENMLLVMGERLAAAPNISLEYQIFTETCPILVSIVTPLIKRIHKEVSISFSASISLENEIIFCIQELTYFLCNMQLSSLPII